MKVCRRCLQEKSNNEFFNDDRGLWCMLCVYNFLLAHGDEEAYKDAREFTHPNFRDVPRSSSWVLLKLRQGLTQLGLLPSSSQGGYAHGPSIQGSRLADATRLPGERALLCEICHQKFGGETVFKAHRKYGTSRGRPSKDAVLKCYSLENTRFTKDENEVWRGATPNFSSIR